MNLLRGQETQSFINRGWVRPGLHGILGVRRTDACLPSSHPLCAGKQRVGRTTTESYWGSLCTRFVAQERRPMGRSCSLIGFGRPSPRRHSKQSRLSSTIEFLRKES